MVNYEIIFQGGTDELDYEDIVLSNEMDPLYVEELYQDHSWPSANGAMMILKRRDGTPTGIITHLYLLGRYHLLATNKLFVSIGIVNCSVHLKGGVRSKKQLNDKSEEIVAVILADIEKIYRARGKIAKQVYIGLALDKWNRTGERGFADWFTRIYLTPPMDRWCVCDTIPGCGTDNNPLESINKAIKLNVCFEKTPTNLTRFIKVK